MKDNSKQNTSQNKDDTKDDTKDNTKDDNIKNDKKCSDFPSMFLGFLNIVPLKLGTYIFILLLITLSKQFIENFMFPMGGEKWVDGDQTTSIGTIVLALIQTLGIITLDLLIKSEIL